MSLEKEAIKEIRSGIFLNNNLRPASDGRTFEVVNPSNKEVAVKELLKEKETFGRSFVKWLFLGSWRLILQLRRLKGLRDMPHKCNERQKNWKIGPSSMIGVIQIFHQSIWEGRDLARGGIN